MGASSEIDRFRISIGLRARAKALSQRFAMLTEMFGSIRPQYFTDVPVDVWHYEVGAYQVCEKWLKDKQGSALTRAEVQQYRGILVAVAETLPLMAEIDAAIGEGWKDGR